MAVKQCNILKAMLTYCPTMLIIDQTAVEAASQGQTTLTGDDTDLLVPLCFNAGANLHSLYFRSEG